MKTSLPLGGAASLSGAPLAPRPPGTRRCLRNSAPLLGDSSRVIVAPMSRRESLSSSPLPDAGCRFASKQRSRNGNKKGRRSRCRGSKNKKYCKTRRKLRGPTPKLGFGPGALRRTQCHRCDRDQHTRCSRLPTCIQRRASPGFNKREQRTPRDRPPLALRADPRLARMRRTSDQARQQDGQEGHRHRPTLGDYRGVGQPQPQPDGAPREHALVPPAHSACSRRHQRAARCALEGLTPPARPSSCARAVADDTDDEDEDEGEDEDEDEDEEAHYPPDAAPGGPSGGRREEEDGSGGPGELTR